MISARFNKYFNMLHTWFAVNRLSLNVSKTNYLIFVNRCVKTHIVVITQLLVVLIDAKLTWEIDISLVKSKLSVETSVVPLCTEPAL